MYLIDLILLIFGVVTFCCDLFQSQKGKYSMEPSDVCEDTGRTGYAYTPAHLIRV